MKRTKKTFTATEQQLDDMLYVLEASVSVRLEEIETRVRWLRQATDRLKQIRNEIRNRRKGTT